MYCRTALTGVVAAACAASLGAGALAATASKPPSDDRREASSRAATVIVDRFLNSGYPPLTSYRARRVLSASTRGGRMRAELEAWTWLDADGTFSFEVVRQAGSGLIRKRVLLAALEEERRARTRGELSQSELSVANYDFELDTNIREDGLVGILLLPRRRTPMLLNGTVTVKGESGDMLSIEGSPSKSPSWWTRRVDVTRRYERITGVRVPVEMRSRADVRFVGESTFSMSYEYESVNGRLVNSLQPTTESVPAWSEEASTGRP